MKPIVEEEIVVVGPFKQGLAVARVGNLFVHVSEFDKKPITDKRFKALGPFSEGLASATKDGINWYHIDCNAKQAYRCRFKAVGNFIGGEALVEFHNTGKTAKILHCGSLAPDKK